MNYNLSCKCDINDGNCIYLCKDKHLYIYVCVCMCELALPKTFIVVQRV